MLLKKMESVTLQQNIEANHAIISVFTFDLGFCCRILQIFRWDFGFFLLRINPILLQMIFQSKSISLTLL